MEFQIEKIKILCFFLLAWSGSAFASPTVCTVTINSTNEVRDFRLYLPKSYKFIELTKFPGAPSKDQNPNAKTWFENACDQNIQCDILVISGHFGGYFFKDDDPIKLSLNQLEEDSCNSRCDGILKKPKEVFLFGCNTLAGKNQDSRTPDEYIENLIEHGASRSQADSTAAFLYSPIGGTIHDQMQRVFSNTPRIYGFSPYAPFGRDISRELSDYLIAATQLGYYDPRNLQNIDKSPNQMLLKSLESTNILQASGQGDSVFPMCYLTSSQVSREEKLQWIEQQLEKDNFWDSIPAIDHFIYSFDGQLKNLSPQELQIFRKIQTNLKAKDKFFEMIQKPIYFMLSTQIDLAKIANTLGWLSDLDYKKTIAVLTFGDLKRPFKGEDDDFICSLNQQMELDAKLIPKARYQDRFFLIALGCAKPIDPQIVIQLRQAYTTANPEIKSHIAETLKKLSSAPMALK